MRTILATALALFSVSAFAVTITFQCASPVTAAEGTLCGVQISPAQGGAVWVYDGARFVSIAPIPSTGTQSWTIKNLAVGNHSLVARVYYSVPAVCVAGQRCSMTRTDSEPATVVVQ